MNYVIGNWKLNPENVEQAEKLFDKIKPKGKDVIICPPFVHLSALKELSSEIELGAQNCFWKEQGAFTGEVSPSMLKEFCSYVIIGHSERRAVLKEDNEMISKKMKAVAKTKMTPILCVGETGEEKEQDKTKQVLREQVQSALKGVEGLDSLIVGYEPRWAIGSGNACSASQAEESASVVKEELKKLNSETYLVYGGSVDSDNAASYKDFFDGWLIGGASLKPGEFNKIIELA